MGKKLLNKQPVLSCKKDENRSCSRGLSGVFDVWQNCSNQRLKLVLGSEYPKRLLKDKMDNGKVPRVDEAKRTVKALMDEESSKERSKFTLVGFSKKKLKSDKQRSNLSEENNKEVEAFINKALKKYLHKDRRNHRSQHFLDVLTILKSNEELFLKLIQDPNSLLAKHIRNLQEVHAEKERLKLVPKPKSSEEALGMMKVQKKNMYNLVWGKIKTGYDYPSKSRKIPRALKQVEISETVSCHCSKNKDDIVEPMYISFKTKSRSTKDDEKKEPKGGVKPEIVSLDENMCKSFGSSIERYSTGSDFDIVEEEAKRHLSERLMSFKGRKSVLDEESPRILGKILHLPQSQIFDLELDKLRLQLLDTKGQEGNSYTNDDSSSTGQMEKDISKLRDFNILEFPSSPRNTNDTIAELNIDSVSHIEEVEDSECSEQVSPLQYQRLVFSLDDSSSTPESVNLPSPVSVLEPLFLDDSDRPHNTIAQPGKRSIQPMGIYFEEHSLTGSYPYLESQSGSSINNLDLISTYLEALLQTSSLSWDEVFLSRQSYSSNQFFNPNTINEVELPHIDFCDGALYFDSVNEAISEVYQCYFKISPFVSSLVSKPVPIETSVIDEIKKKVHHYLCPPVLPQTIEQLAGEDHIRSHIWMDSREDIEETTVQVVESILEELTQEAVLDIVV